MLEIVRILEVLPLPRIQGLHLLIQNLLITAMVQQLIYLLMHQRYDQKLRSLNTPMLSLFTYWCIDCCCDTLPFLIMILSPLGLEKEGEGTPSQGD